MNYTEHYHLPQWVKEDRVMMEDFNQMCADLEAGLNRNAQTAASAAAAASNNAAAAQSTANTALARANAAYSPSQQPYAVGTYKGNGDSLTVTLGFQPKFVIISAQSISGGYDTPYFPTRFAMAGLGANIGGLSLLSNGFKVSYTTINNSACPPGINNNGVTYAYIAFR